MGNKTKWELINPEGIARMPAVGANPHPESLVGKTVLLRWNGKHNGDIFLNRIGELLQEQVTGVKIIKAWEAVPETKAVSSNANTSKQLAKKLADLKPNISIGAQGD